MSGGTLVALMLAVFTVSVGYGVVLPLLPYLVERLLGVRTGIAWVARNTGLLTGVYTLALFLFAPLWGQASDRYGRRSVLLIGLVGFGVTMLLSFAVETLASVYAQRFLSGMFAAAVTPVASAAVSDLAVTKEARAHRLTLVSLAGIAGFLLGPPLGVLVARLATNVMAVTSRSGSLAAPLAATALLAFLVAAAVATTLPRTKPGDTSPVTAPVAPARSDRVVPTLLTIAFVVSAGVGVFEVGLALRGKQELGLTSLQIATMFTECSLVMFVVQAIVFSPWVKPDSTRWLIAPALAVLAAGLFLIPRTADFRAMVTMVGAVAASAGILSPILTYWISSTAGHAQGAQLGKQTAAASLGAAVGSAAGGLLFDIGPLPDASFMLMALVTVVGMLVSVGLPRRLAAHTAVQLHPRIVDRSSERTRS